MIPGTLIPAYLFCHVQAGERARQLGLGHLQLAVVMGRLDAGLGLLLGALGALEVDVLGPCLLYTSDAADE